MSVNKGYTGDTIKINSIRFSTEVDSNMWRKTDLEELYEFIVDLASVSISAMFIAMAVLVVVYFFVKIIFGILGAILYEIAPMTIVIIACVAVGYFFAVKRKFPVDKWEE